MELSNDGANARLQDVPETTEEHEDRPSVELRPSPRLQKKRSNPGSKPANRRPQTFAAPTTTTERDGNKARKGSIRNAIRRVFGRKSREPEPEPEPAAVQGSPSQHGYHRSEPTGMAPQQGVTHDDNEDDDLIQRTFSVPVAPIATSVQRARSPYAVEFPQSSRLKPINLGSPFMAPGSTLRRRKTLPSLLISGSEAAAVREAVQSQDEPRGASIEEAQAGEIGMALGGTDTSERRKSRSADDLRLGHVGGSRLSRKRSEEIQFWRESIQGTVLRASGFRVPSPELVEPEPKIEDRTPVAQLPDPFLTQGESSGLSPPGRRPQETTPSALGTELSQDLEDRVARLEAGLRTFRGELAQMAADRNRRTILIGSGGGSTRRRRASSGGRTGSMLAETLASDLEPSSYRYEYSGGARPSTSPEPPRTPTRFADPSAAVPAMPVYQRTSEERYRTPPPPGPSVITPPRNGNGNGNTSGNENGTATAGQQNPVPQYTFRSLYEMLTDERSARRRLEQQLRGLRQDINNLNYQVSLQSNVQSQRSSYNQGSNRLQALLRETEHSPPRTDAQQQRTSDMTGLSADQQRVVSRFSGSESESGLTDLQTPYEAYQTPQEEQAQFPLGGRMF